MRSTGGISTLRVIAIYASLLIFGNIDNAKHATNAFVPAQQSYFQHTLPTQNPLPANRCLERFSPSTFELYSTASAFDTTTNSTSEGIYTYKNVQWELKPWLKNKNENSPLNKITNPLVKGLLKVASNLIRLDCKLKGKTPPKVLCPRSGQAVLEAYVKQDKGIGALFSMKKKIARFGITTHRGPPAPEIISTIQQVYKNTPMVQPGVAAIIYMFVEPEYRSAGLGEMALEIISSIHALQRCDFTILVADDDGSGKLIDWYSTNGFEKAPLMQDLMGSPGGTYGTTMIRPTIVSAEFYNECKVKWW